jgi:hypothetical protein
VTGLKPLNPKLAFATMGPDKSQQISASREGCSADGTGGAVVGVDKWGEGEGEGDGDGEGRDRLTFPCLHAFCVAWYFAFCAWVFFFLGALAAVLSK